MKSENVVDEQQRVRAFFVAEEFCDRQPGQRDPQTRARRLGHLPVNQRGFGLIRIARLDYAGLGHFQPKIVAFARTFAHTGEYGISAMLFGDVVDQFLNKNGFADTGAAEQSNLPAFQERLDEIDDFYAGFKHFGGGRLIFKQRGRAVDGHGLGVLDRPQLVNGRSNYVHHAAQRAPAYGNGNRSALVDRFHAAHHAFGSFHGDAAHAPFAQVLLHFQNHIDRVRNGEAVADDFQRLVNRRHGALDELHVHRRTGNLNYVSNSFRHKTSGVSGCWLPARTCI